MQLCVLLLVGAGKSISEIFATVGGAIRKNSSLPPLQELLGRKRAYLREATFARGRDLFLQWKQERMLGEREPGEMLTAVPSALSAAAAEVKRMTAVMVVTVEELVEERVV